MLVASVAADVSADVEVSANVEVSADVEVSIRGADVSSGDAVPVSVAPPESVLVVSVVPAEHPSTATATTINAVRFAIAHPQGSEPGPMEPVFPAEFNL